MQEVVAQPALQVSVHGDFSDAVRSRAWAPLREPSEWSPPRAAHRRGGRLSPEPENQMHALFEQAGIPGGPIQKDADQGLPEPECRHQWVGPDPIDASTGQHEPQ